MKILYSFLASMILSTNVFADGTHGVKVEVINKSGYKIEILTYNSKDGSMTVPHKVYYADAGGVRTVKAHGQGTGKLKMEVSRQGKMNAKCYESDGGAIRARGKKYADGTTVIVNKCDYPEDQGF